MEGGRKNVSSAGAVQQIVLSFTIHLIQEELRVNKYEGNVTPTDLIIWAVMDDLDYKPRNTKEKWQLGIAYWGTIALVALSGGNMWKQNADE